MWICLSSSDGSWSASDSWLFLQVDYTDHAALVDIFKQVTVVISTVGFPLILDQIKFLEAAKEAGTITRFLPSEFGLEPR